jgi:hypothetical protein
MKRNLVLILTFGVSLWLAGDGLAGGPKWSLTQAGGTANGSVRGSTVQRYWRPAPAASHYPFYHYRHSHFPYYYYGHNPRSIIIITPSAYYPYSTPVTVVTSEPYYCHMHHVGFVSRVGFLDHISGTHKIPLETADSICTDSNESCIIEGY